MTESYGAVPPSEESVERSATLHRSVFYLTVVLVSLAVVGVMVGVSIFRVLEVTPTPAVQGGLPPPVAMEQGRCRMCTFKECMADHCPRIRTNCTSCDWDRLISYFLITVAAPTDLCVAGMSSLPQPGCSEDPHQWMDSPFCTDCCSSEFCWLDQSLPVGHPDEPHRCPACTHVECRIFAHVCPYPIYPFVCTSGGATNGCTGNPYEWPLTAACDACCDLTACWV